MTVARILRASILLTGLCTHYWGHIHRSRTYLHRSGSWWEMSDLHTLALQVPAHTHTPSHASSDEHAKHSIIPSLLNTRDTREATRSLSFFWVWFARHDFLDLMSITVPSCNFLCTLTSYTYRSVSVGVHELSHPTLYYCYFTPRSHYTLPLLFLVLPLRFRYCETHFSSSFRHPLHHCSLIKVWFSSLEHAEDLLQPFYQDQKRNTLKSKA